MKKKTYSSLEEIENSKDDPYKIDFLLINNGSSDNSEEIIRPLILKLLN